MTNWDRLLVQLDKVFGFEDRARSTVNKRRQGFDEKTNEHVFILEYRDVKGTGEHSDPKKRKDASIERRVNRKQVNSLLRDINDRANLSFPQTTKVGFIGLGDMGFPMARRLLNHGFPVVSCANRRREAIEDLKGQGLVEVRTPRAVGERAELLMTIVADAKQTDAVLRGDTGALSSMKSGSIVVIMSTLDPSYCKDVAAEAASRGINVLDCPVSGGNVRADNGTLTLMVGGKDEALQRARAALESMGTVYHCGDVGMGQVVKLANNAIALTTVAVVNEARAMARSCGADTVKLMEITGHSTGQSFIGDHWDYVVSEWSHLAPLAKKDVNLGIAVARANGVSMPLIEARYAGQWELDPNEYE